MRSHEPASLHRHRFAFLSKVTKKTNAVDNTTVDASKKVKTTKAVNAAKGKKVAKKENFFVRIWKKFAKLCKDTVGEMKKVVWTPKADLKKSTRLVIVAVVAISVIIAVIDTACSYLINTVAGLLG